MNTDPTNTPDQLGTYRERCTIFRIPGSPDPGVYISPDFFGNLKGIQRYLIWHWHWDSDNGVFRWQGAGLGLHTLVNEEPLTLMPSLGCDATAGIPNGCTNHGWVREGTWIPA